MYKNPVYSSCEAFPLGIFELLNLSIGFSFFFAFFNRVLNETTLN